MINKIITSISHFILRFSRAIIWTFSILIGFLIIIQISIAASVFWLNSDSGQTFIKSQISNTTNDTGYNVAFDKISYAFLRGLKIQNLIVKDDDGIILDINIAIINPNFIGLGIRHFGVSIDADKFIVHRLPKSKTENDPDALNLKPFTLPDIYFTSIGIDQFNIQTLDIKQDVFGIAMILSTELSSKLSITDTLNLDVNIDIDSNDIPWMPNSIMVDGNLDPQSLDIVLDNLNINNNILEFTANGNANLNTQGSVDIQSSLAINDFKPLTQGLEGTANAEILLSGSMDALSIKSKGRVSLPILTKNGLDDVTFTITDDNLSMAPIGTAKLNAQYQDTPINLSAMFDINENIMTVQSIKGNAPDLILNGNVDINLDNLLADGRIVIDATKIKTYTEMADLTVNGHVNAIIDISHHDELQIIGLQSTFKNVVYETMSVELATLSTQIIDIQNPWPNNLKATAKNIRASDDVTITSLKADLSKEGDDNHRLSMDINGRAIHAFNIKGGTILSGLKQSQLNATNINLKLSSNGSSMTMTGQLNQNDLDISLNTKNFTLASLPLSLPGQLHDLMMRGDARIFGKMAQPSLTGIINLTPIEIVKGGRITLSAIPKYDNNLARIDISGTGDAIDTLNGYVQVPLKISLNPFVFDLPPTTQLDGQITMDAQAKALAALLLPVGQKLTGEVDVNATIVGTVQNPNITGRAALLNGTYAFDAYGVELFDIDMKADLSSDSIEILTLTANDGHGGQLNGNGRVHFTAQQNTKLDLNLSNFKLLDNDKAKGTISADLDFQNNLFSGDITLGEFNIIIPERFQTKIPQLNIVETGHSKNKSQLKDIKLNIDVIANDRIFVRGWGLDAEFGGNINVGGNLDNPQLDGLFESKRGRYEEFGRRFTVERAILRFQGSAPPSPYLDIVATTNENDINASVKLSGEIGNPIIALSSIPPLPEDEVMSHILFGENLSQITPFQAIQLKQTLDRFTGKGGGGFNPLGKLRDITGLDDIRVDTNDAGETSVGVGKYLTEDVYLELEKGSGDESGTAKIQVEVTPNINLESKVGQDAQAGGGVIWRWDY